MTDALLLALAARNGGTLVTFDREVANLAQADAVQVALLGL